MQILEFKLYLRLWKIENQDSIHGEFLCDGEISFVQDLQD